MHSIMIKHSITPSLLAAILLLGPTALAQEGPGLAADYPDDVGLDSHPDVLYFLDFNDEAASRDWFGDQEGYGWTGGPSTRAQREGAPSRSSRRRAHMIRTRFIPRSKNRTSCSCVGIACGSLATTSPSTRCQASMPRPRGASGAGEIPTGYDKYSCKLYVDFERRPRFYTYHPEQSGIYGDGLHMNLVDPPIEVEAGRWYCFEMMIKANDTPAHDGELKMWIDGQLVGHYTDMRFRDTNDLKINEFTYSAYVGGSWTSERDQKLWDDQIVVARQYIGPLSSEVDGGAGGKRRSSWRVGQRGPRRLRRHGGLVATLGLAARAERNPPMCGTNFGGGVREREPVMAARATQRHHVRLDGLP